MVKTVTCDVVVIGAGVAGLTAAGILKRAGQDVRCLEASNRVGGRIFTLHDALAPVAIELGAEFVHGRPPQTWELIRATGLTAYEHTAEAVHLEGARVVTKREVGELADRLLSRMGKPGRKRDESFEDYLRRSREKAKVKNWARGYVEGFNAARSELISVASLRQDAEAADKIEGDRTFRIPGGYDSIPLTLLRSIPDHAGVVQLNSTVERVDWSGDFVRVKYRSAPDGRESELRCRRLIVTVPLGVLRAAPGIPGAIQFDPEPGGILKAARSLEFGQVYRITFRFANAFWEDDERLKGAGFLITRDQGIRTWWTTHPIISPLLTGWAAGPAADRFLSSDLSTTAAEGLASLARILNRKVPQPDAVYFHDWHADPFFRGAYSYAPVNGLRARDTLSRPVEGTLFFAGEATETNGHSGTVHGAIASGIRAAADVQAV